MGLTPEDVGLGRGEALTRAVGIAFYLLVAVTFVFLLYIFLKTSVRLIDRIGGGFVERPTRTSEALWRGGLFSVVGLFVFIIASVLWSDAHELADAVQRGEKVRPFFLLDTGVHAEKAKITWVGDAPADLVELPTHRLMFLGQSGGTVVLYDVDDKRSIRIPSSNVGVSILP